MTRKVLTAELRLKNYKTDLGETSGNKKIIHIGIIKLVGVFNTLDDVNINITIKGDIGRTDAILESLNLPNIRDVLALDFVPNPQMRIDEIERKNKRE